MAPTNKKSGTKDGESQDAREGSVNSASASDSEPLSISSVSTSPGPYRSQPGPMRATGTFTGRAPKRGRKEHDSGEEEQPPPKKQLRKPGKVPPRKRRQSKRNDAAEDDAADDSGDDDATLGNTRPQIPRVRGGQLYDTDQEPITPDFSVTGYQRSRRQLALRNRIAPHPVTSEQVENHLNATGWDVDRAYQRWNVEHLRALAAVGREELIRPTFDVCPPARDQESEQDEEEESEDSEDFISYPHDASSERERRRLVTFLRNLVEDARALEGTVPLKISEAVMLLRETGWDVVRARDLYLEHQYAFDTFTNSYNSFRGPSQVRSEQDERLSQLIDLTGRRDIDSLDAHLRRHNYNFIAAVVAWQKSGIPSINIAERPEVDCELPIPDHVSWKSENESDEEYDEGTQTEQEKDEVKHVKTINTDRVGANLGIPDHTKMVIEYIKNGKYTVHIFQHRNYRWSDKDPKDLPEFDWNRQGDINILNSWRREIFGRVEGEVTHPRTVPWLEEEDDFIYDLHRELWDELIAENPGADPQSFLPLPVPQSRQRQWADRLNAQFAGHRLAGSGVRRPERSFGAINIRRQRVQRIIDDFKIERNDPHPKHDEDKPDKQAKSKKPPK